MLASPPKELRLLRESLTNRAWVFELSRTSSLVRLSGWSHPSRFRGATKPLSVLGRRCNTEVDAKRSQRALGREPDKTDPHGRG